MLCSQGMLVVHVYLKIKPECIEAFKEITRYNAANSIKEPGIARFDVVQQRTDPTRFVLVEAYYEDGAQALHRETEHYLKWRATVEEMQAEPRTFERFESVFPEVADWAH